MEWNLSVGFCQRSFWPMLLCVFGKIAAKHGKNPLLYGILSIGSPVNLAILGWWAFSNTSTGKEKDEKE